MPSAAFIQKLLSRLKNGDTRSIHLNALPANFARLDVYDLSNIEPGLHLKFLELLLSQASFRFSVSVDPALLFEKKAAEQATDRPSILRKLIKRLNHLDYQEREQVAEHGYHTFGFGYPLLIRRDPNNPDRILKAPVLIWYLRIEKDQRRNNSWIISRSEEQIPVFNELLRAHLESTEMIRMDDLEEMLDEELMDEKKLIGFCARLLSGLNVPFDAGENIATLLPCTNKETLEQVSAASPWIRWSGVFGLYKMQKQSIIRDLNECLAKNIPSEEQNIIPFFEGEVLTPVKLDPSQENVLQQLKQNNALVVQGPPGTGKSQTLTALITQALLNKNKILVVCEKRTAMEVLLGNLKKENLDTLAVLIEDVHTDRKAIVDRVREHLDMQEQKSVSRFRAHEYEQLRAKFLSLQEEINHRINFSNAPFFGDDNWMELLSKSVELEADEENRRVADLLSGFDLPAGLSFTYDEFLNIKERLHTIQEYCGKLSESAFVFDELSPAVFTIQPEAGSVLQQLEQWMQRASQLSESLRSNRAAHGDRFDLLHGLAFKAIDTFSFLVPQFKKLRGLQIQALSAYSSLFEEIRAEGYFAREIQVYPEQEQLSSLMPTLEQLQIRIHVMLDARRDFGHFYTFKKELLSQPPSIQELVQRLMLANAANWPEAFEVYYLRQLIRRTAAEQGWNGHAANQIRILQETDPKLKHQLSAKIRADWEERVGEMLAERPLSDIRYLYNQRKNKVYTSRNSLRKIIHTDFEFFSTLFPVIMLNPSVAASVLPLKAGIFDLVILDEASQLRLEDTYTSLLRGKVKVVSGDRQQMPPSNYFGSEVVFWNEEDDNGAEDFLAESQSLLEYADDAAFRNTYLDFHYRSLHPDLIAFSNHAFYQSRLIPMPEKEAYQALHYRPVGGIYREGINAEEARAVVQYLYGIEAKEGAYPSVGVATFNIFQRDFILDELYEQAYADKEKQAVLQALLAKGLFVKNLENIQGDERDIMILSTTFGPDEHGRFRQHFGPLSRDKGYQLLNVIITRAKHSLYVFTSVPEQVFLQFEPELKQKGNTGKAVFYAYLSYVKAISEENEEQAGHIRNILSAKEVGLSTRSSFDSNGKLKEMLFEHLRQAFGDAVQIHYRLGGFVLDLLILKEKAPFLHISLEQAHHYHPGVAYRIKLHQQEMLANYGILTYHLWSYNWWLDPKAELDKISKIIHG